MRIKNLFVKKQPSGIVTIERPRHLLYIVTVAFLPIASICVLLLALFRKLVQFCLTFWYGKQFGGLLTSGDVMWVLEEKEWRNIVTVVYIVERDDDKIDLFEKTKARVKEKVFDVDDYPKLKGTCHSILGYSYTLLDTYTIDECVKEFRAADDLPFNENTLKDYVSEICNQPLPLKGTSMWEVLVSHKPFDRNNGEKYTYPIVFRFNHAVSDGLALVELMSKVFHSPNAHEYLAKCSRQYSAHLNKNNTIDRSVALIKTTLDVLYHLYVWLGLVAFWHLIRTRDRSVLHGPKLSGKKITVWSGEDQIMGAMKNIKAKIKGVTFTDVLFTAVSASLTEYLRKSNGNGIPDFMAAGVPIVLNHRPNMSKPVPAYLNNNFALGGLILPTVKTSLVQTLMEIREYSALMRRSPEIKCYLWLSQIVSRVLPAPLLRALTCFDGTASISNLISSDDPNVVDAAILRRSVFFTPHRSKTGLGFGILTSGNRIDVALVVDKVLISSREEAQKVIDDIFLNVKRLEEETRHI